MKRILSIALVIMLLASVTAFADDYDILKMNYTGYEADVSFTLSADEPMDILSVLPDIGEARSFVNLQGLAEGLANSVYTGHVKLNASADYTKMQVSYELRSVIPLEINKNFRLTGEMVLGMWIDWDISDELNPKMSCIYTMPICDKYISTDIVSMMEERGINTADFAAAFKRSLSRGKIEELSDKFIGVLRENSSISSKGARIEITATGSQLESIAAQSMDIVKDYLADNKDFDLLADSSAGAAADMLPDSEDVKSFFDEVDIFGENALTVEIVKNPSGTVKSTSTRLSFAIDVNELCEDKIITNVPPTLKFSITAGASYRNVNSKNVVVGFPQLTEENSVTLEELFDYDYSADYDWSGEGCPHYEYADIYDELFIPAKDGTLYFSLNDITDEFNTYGHSYEISRDGDSVQLSDTSGNERFSSASMRIGSDKLFIDGNEYTLTNPVTLSGYDIIIDTDAAMHIFGASVDYASVSLENNMLSGSLTRRSPMCSHTDEEIESMYGDYCEHYQMVYVISDIPYSGAKYLELRDLINEVYYYDDSGYTLSYDDGVITLTDLSGTEKFNTAVFTVGSAEYYIDGQAAIADNPTVEYNGYAHIDISAAQKLFGLEEADVSLSFRAAYTDEDTGYVHSPGMYLNADLVRKSPRCPHTDEELEDVYKWWED